MIGWHREEEVHLASTDCVSVKGSFGGVCVYHKKKAGHKCKGCLEQNAKQGRSESGSFAVI